MTMMKKLVLVLCVLPMAFAFSGCGESKVVKDMNAVADGVCECKDLDCAKKAFGPVEKMEEPKEISDEDKKKVESAMKKAGECMAKLATAKK